MQQGKFYRPYDKEHNYIPQGPNDIGKRAIPKAERCDNFDELWNMIFDEVVSYWDYEREEKESNNSPD